MAEGGISVCMKSKRLRFDMQLDLLLVQTVSVIEAHVAKHGELDVKQEEILAASSVASIYACVRYAST